MISSKQYERKAESRKEEAVQLIDKLEKQGFKGEVCVYIDGCKVNKIKKSEYV